MAILQQPQGGPPQQTPPPAQQQTPAPQQAPMGAPDAQGIQTDAQGRQFVDGDQDAAFDLLTANIESVVITQDGKAKPQVMESLARPIKEGRKPAEALAHTSATLVSQVLQSGVQNGQQFSGHDHAAPALQFAVQTLAELALHEGVHDFSEDEMVQAMNAGGEILYGQTQDLGIWSEQQDQQEFSDLLQASQSGQLDQELAEIQAEGGMEQAPPQGGMPQPGGQPLLGGQGGQ